jgi:transposase
MAGLWQDPRDPWKDLPGGYPPYQTRHRRSQRWIEEGVLGDVLEALAEDLEARGEIDLSESVLCWRRF